MPFRDPLTHHGGRLDESRRRWPDAPGPWIDLSTGINPRPYPLATAAAADQQALPSPDALGRLEAAAARAFGMTAGAIAAVPGSEVALRLLDTIGLPAPVRVRVPCYRTHLAAFPDAERDAEATGVTGTTLLANPNNPNGRVDPPEALLRRGHDALVVDEAFADAVPGASVLPHLSGGEPVLVLRSFGKFYGLAGLRLGFVCGSPDWVEAIRRRLGDWPVSATAIALGTAAYADGGWATATRGWLREQAARLDAVLAGAGLDARGGCPLFRTVATAAAPALFERLGRAGILVRPFDDESHRLRFGLPADDAALDRLAGALRDR